MYVSRTMLVLFISLLPIGLANAESTELTESIRLLMDRSGISNRLQEFPRQVLSEIGQEKDSSQTKTYTPNRDAFVRAFNVKTMEHDLVVQMGKYVDEPLIVHALTWFQSPLGMRIADLERAAFTAHTSQGKQAFVEWLLHNPPAQSRIVQIQRLIETTYLAHIEEDLEMTTAMAVTGAMNATLPPEEHINPDHIRHQIQVQRDDQKQILKQEQLINFLFLYHRLQDQELEQYLEFLYSSNGQRFSTSMQKSLKAVFRLVGERVGTALGRAVKGEREI